jgi:transposase InsO family protein
MNKITQEMKYRESIVNYALSHGVSRASRKYNKSRSYIYFWLKRYDGEIESLVSHSRRPHHHPNEHRPEEIQLIRRMWQKNRETGLNEFWFKLRERSYTRSLSSLFRVMGREGLLATKKKPKKKYQPKPYEAMQYPGQRVQVDVKVVPIYCIKDKNWKKYYQYTAIDEYSRFRFLEAYQQANTWSSANFVRKLVTQFKRHSIRIETIQTDNGFEFTSHFHRNEPAHLSLFEQTLAKFGIHHKRIKPYTPRHNGKVERSHREDQKRFYSRAVFYSFSDFRTQLKRHNYRSNRIPMKPLGFISPVSFLAQRVQDD